MKTVAIFGVGLIGGSFALALRKAGFEGRILGVSSPVALRGAVDSGLIDSGASPEQACREAGFLYLSQPIHRILSTLETLGRHAPPGLFITDAGSTKTAIVRHAAAHLRSAQFLGGHPLAGKESRGWQNADADLFRNQVYVLTPEAAEDLKTEAAQEFLGWLDKFGCHTLTLRPEDHDRLVARTSHLPQLLSTALASFLQTQDARTAAVHGPALIDATRLALSPFEIWRDIVQTNAPAIRDSLDGVIAVLERMRESLERASLESDFLAGEEFARRVRMSSNSGRELTTR